MHLEQLAVWLGQRCLAWIRTLFWFITRPICGFYSVFWCCNIFFWLQIFDLFDVKKRGVIDFGDFVRSLNVFHPNASQEDKINCKLKIELIYLLRSVSTNLNTHTYAHTHNFLHQDSKTSNSYYKGERYPLGYMLWNKLKTYVSVILMMLCIWFLENFKVWYATDFYQS